MLSHVMVEANTIRAQHADKLRDSVHDRPPGGLYSTSDDDAQQAVPPTQARDARAQRAFSVSPMRRQVWTDFLAGSSPCLVISTEWPHQLPQ
jgi:hypothetical protein